MSTLKLLSGVRETVPDRGLFASRDGKRYLNREPEVEWNKAWTIVKWSQVESSGFKWSEKESNSSEVDLVKWSEMERRGLERIEVMEWSEMNWSESEVM